LGRRKKEEGRRKKEEGRRKKEVIMGNSVLTMLYEFNTPTTAGGLLTLRLMY
jgi:hypothetical protein